MKEFSIQKVYKTTLFVWWYTAILAIGIFVLVSFLFNDTIFTEDPQLNFIFLTAMELITLCVIPFALRLFKFKWVKKLIKKQGTKGLLDLKASQILMLSGPMILNAMMYFLTRQVAHFYLAVILFLCMFFIYPSQEQLTNELDA
ncbi:MAG: hypothetical protein J5971_08680 [Prevotella sp.]|nr:hypothetical protein [Prevotella sp.]